MIVSADELDRQYENPDPWGYDGHPEDAKRRDKILTAIPAGNYKRTLDIGCGNGFITERLPGQRVIGTDLSRRAIFHAVMRCAALDHSFIVASIFDLPSENLAPFDLVVITGFLYPQYIGQAAMRVRGIVDDLLEPNGVLISCHIEKDYSMSFSYPCIHRERYPYREFTHLLEIYRKAERPSHDSPLPQG